MTTQVIVNIPHLQDNREVEIVRIPVNVDGQLMLDHATVIETISEAPNQTNEHHYVFDTQVVLVREKVKG